MTAEWRPTAPTAALRTRAAMLALARTFFLERGVLEVETPILSEGGTTDPQIDSLTTHVRGIAAPFHLGTSPEFAMKRLIAAGCGDIYQICKVFRDGERGRWHNPEFTMIEWYRLGYDDTALMDEVEEIVARMLVPRRRLAAAERLGYAAAIRRHAGVDAERADLAALRRAAAANGVHCDADLDRDAARDLLMGLVVGPRLGRERPAFICDYPASQASLARLKPGDPPVAARFEFYLDGIELANGFHELSDAAEQRARFEADLQTRRERGRAEPALDERLIAALAAGLPDCDRLAAIAVGADALAGAMAFPIERA